MAEPMKIRAQLNGDTLDIKIVMYHPMETGQRKDPKTGQLVPAHYIQTLTAVVNGKIVMSAQCGPAIAKNPFLGLRVKGAKTGEKVVVSWEDSKGEKNSAETTVI
jgi:sulfur-oxidizing protein SoxZ